MRTMFNVPLLIIAACLSVSACTDKTVVSEPSSSTEADAANETELPISPGDMPGAADVILLNPTDMAEPEAPTEQTDSTQTNALQGAAAEPGDAATPVTLDDLDESTQESSETNGESTPDNSLETAVAESTPGIGVLLSDPVATPDAITDTPVEAASIGAPGASVNCDLTLPCRWLSDDSQFFVTVTNADNIGSSGRLVIEYSVSSLHDTQVTVSSTEPAIDNAGGNYGISAVRLGEAEGTDTQELLAGESAPASIQFDSVASADSIDYWSIGLSDSGLLRQAVFRGIPIGSETTLAADCTNALPCVWESPAKDATITLLNVTGSGTINQLRASFTVETTRDLTVAVDAGATATGTDGMSYRGRTHSIGDDTGAGKLTGNTIAGAQITGTVFFFRTQSVSEALQTLSLIVYEDIPLPQWNPEFFNVPVQ